MSAFLLPADLFRITGKRRYKAQCRALDGLGIRYRTAANGEPLVRPEALDGDRPKARNEPRWHRLNAP